MSKETISNLLETNTQLDNKIRELEKKNILLEENNKKFKIQQNYIDNLENENIDLKNNIANLNKNIEDLERESERFRETKETINTERINIVNLENKIRELEKEKNLLKEDNKKLKFEQNYIDILEKENINLENKIDTLQEKINNLETENQKYFEKNDILKSALLLNTDAETKSTSDEIGILEKGFVSNIEKEKEVKDIVIEKNAVITAEQKSETSTVKEIEKEIYGDKITTIITEPKITSPPPVYETPKDTRLIYSRELVKEKEPIRKGLSEGKRICPKCRNHNKRLIYELTDKTNIIMAYPRIYGKKFKCGQCGAEWR